MSMIEVAELQAKYGREWFRHYGGNPMNDENVKAAGARVRIVALYLGILILAVECLGIVAAPILILKIRHDMKAARAESAELQRRLSAVEEAQKGVGRRVEFWLPPGYAVPAEREKR